MTARAAGLWVLLAVLWFGTLAIRPLYKADESRYAEISREMVASGDWLTPRLNGFKYFEKPPLQYWASAVLFKVFGEHDWVARLWTALLGLAGIALTFYAANRLFGPPIGAYAAAMLAGAPLYVVLGQVNTLDMGVTFFLSAAVFALGLGRPLWFWIACALAVLSKGLIGIVLPLGTVALSIMLARDWTLVRRLRPVVGGTLFLLIAAPWFIAVSMANPEFAHFFFVQEHFQRFTTQMHQRVHPWWYFVPVLAAGFAPWLAPLARSALVRLRERSGTELLFWCWALVVFVFFSASGSKLPPYIVPIFPALAERPRADAPVFAVDVYDHTIPWNLRRTVTMVHYRDELGVAVDWEPAKFVPDLAAFAARWRAEREAWAFVPANAVERLSRELGIEMQVMARGPQYAIVKKP